MPDQGRAEHIRKEYLGAADHMFCTVSRLAKEKNIYFQLEGLACLKRLLQKTGRSFKHLMIGDGPERRSFEKRVRELGLADEIVFVENVPNAEIKNYQAASDLFLFTSKSETQGIVLLEAMAAENPVVAVEASGVCDVVCNGENGYMTPEDADVWARKIADTIADRTLLASLGEGARRTAELCAEEWIALRAAQCYEQVCAKAPQEIPDRISIFHHSHSVV